MTRIVCAPPELLPDPLIDGVEYVAMYSASTQDDVGKVGTGLIRELQRAGLSPSPEAWDFLTLALAVSAADLAVHRQPTVDGWTRMMDLEVALFHPAPFTGISQQLAGMLKFLTGDHWTLNFLNGGRAPPYAPTRYIFDYEADCVSLLSGGVDSLVGGIDLVHGGRQPLFVSQIARGDSDTQTQYARRLGAADRHLQWNQNIMLAHDTERSTRARSIVFFAFALLAAEKLLQQGMNEVVAVVPENGFISVNIPLNAGRVGSLSTKTTHPVFMEGMQAAWTALGFPVRLQRPYAFQTKGEMLENCQNRQLLEELVGASTSCGRFGYYGYRHCGRCVPCMVRRASFIRAGMQDTTQQYVFTQLATTGRENGANDIGAAAAAVLRLEDNGIRHLTAGQLAFAPAAQRAQYADVVSRGLAELGVLLRQQGVI